MESKNAVVRLVSEFWESLSEEKDRGCIFGAGFAGGAYSPHLFGFSVGVWSPLINGAQGLLYIGMSAVVAKIFLKIYHKTIVPKIKYLQDDKEKKDDDQRRA